MSTAQERVLTDMERREALRAGVDVRPGRMVKVEIDSRASGAHAGVVIQCGKHPYEIHERDVPALEALVETRKDKLASARDHYESSLEEFQRAKGAGLVRPSLEASFQIVARDQIKPFDSVRVVAEKKS